MYEGKTTAQLNNIGAELYKQKDYARARQYWEQAAEKGHAEALANLGLLYANGEGVAQDYVRARQYCEQAAEKGDLEALVLLGLFYENGYGVPQDYARARRYYEQGAEQGDAGEFYNSLGTLYESGEEIISQDYTRARQYYELAAEKGDADALTNLGLLYENSYGVPQDYVRARRYYEQAAEKGEADALTCLGVLYANGRGVPQDYALARHYWEQAAKKGNLKALILLGALYHNGYGVPQNYARARQYYEQAAEKGNAGALASLGVLYEHGQGVPQNYARARQYYEQAAEKGNAEALANLGFLYKNSQGVPQDYARARHYYEQAAEKGNVAALTNLGLIYDNGEGVPQDYARARRYYEQAAEKGNVRALANLGLLYDNGEGVPQDYARARRYYEQAAEKGNADALTYLGLLYANGQGVAQDYVRARQYYEQAAEKGNVDALTNLGILYADGEGVAQDYARARHYFEQAAEKGNVEALVLLGVLYENGYGVPQNYARARHYYEQAAEKGDAGELYNSLGSLYENGEEIISQDYTRARQYYELAVEKGSREAAENLAKLLSTLTSVSPKTSKATPLADIILRVEQQVYATLEDKFIALQKALAANTARIENLTIAQQQLQAQQSQLDVKLGQLAVQKASIEERIRQLTQLQRQGQLPPKLQEELAALRQQQNLLMREYERTQVVKAQQQHIAQSQYDKLSVCYNQLQLKLNAWFTGYLVLQSGVVQASASTAQNVMAGISILGEMIDMVPGVGLLTSIASKVVDHVSERKTQFKAMQVSAFGVSTGAMGELVEALARKMVLHYESSLMKLTLEGADAVGQWCAKPIIEWVYVVEQPAFLVKDDLVEQLFSVLQQAGVPETTPVRSGIMDKLREKLSALRKNLKKDAKVRLTTGEEISIRDLLHGRLQAVKTPVAEPNSLIKHHLEKQEREMQALRQQQELLQKTQQIALSGTVYSDGGRTATPARAASNELSTRRQAFGGLRAAAHSMSMASLPVAEVNEPYHLQSEPAIDNYDGRKAGTIYCKIGEEFIILRTSKINWVYVQRVSNSEKGYLPRSCFMWDD